MDDRWSQYLEYAVLVGTLVFAAVAAVVVLEVTTVDALDADSLPRWTVVAGLVLLGGAIALPAYILVGWQSTQEGRAEATRERRRS